MPRLFRKCMLPAGLTSLEQPKRVLEKLSVLTDTHIQICICRDTYTSIVESTAPVFAFFSHLLPISVSGSNVGSAVSRTL